MAAGNALLKDRFVGSKAFRAAYLHGRRGFSNGSGFENPNGFLRFHGGNVHKDML